MKTLGKLGDWSYGIYDHNNFFVGKVKNTYREGRGEELQLKEAKYFRKLADACCRVVELASMDECDPSLGSYAECVSHAKNEICEKLAQVSQLPPTLTADTNG
jgi:hypothetical protein